GGGGGVSTDPFDPPLLARACPPPHRPVRTQSHPVTSAASCTHEPVGAVWGGEEGGFNAADRRGSGWKQQAIDCIEGGSVGCAGRGGAGNRLGGEGAEFRRTSRQDRSGPGAIGLSTDDGEYDFARHTSA
ncbi:MAG: hypothetical protein ACR2OZ_15170, partial [Verrucomicrobiales bacterium]